MAPHKTLITRTLVLILALWGLAVIVPDFARVFTAYATLGFQADNDGVITAVDGPPASDAGLGKNDCIDLKRTKLSDLLAVFGGMGGMTYVHPGLEVTLYVEPAPCTPSYSGATPRDLKARLKIATAANRLMLAIDEILGVFFIVMGAVLVWQRPNAMTWGSFFTVCGSTRVNTSCSMPSSSATPICFSRRRFCRRLRRPWVMPASSPLRCAFLTTGWNLSGALRNACCRCWSLFSSCCSWRASVPDSDSRPK